MLATINIYSGSEIKAAKIAQAKEMVRHNLANSDRWLVRGLLAIYARQTADEKNSQHTKYDNDIGFNAVDAPLLSSFAKQVKKWENTPEIARKYRSPLSPKQLYRARVKMAKYSGQLVMIAKSS